MGGIVSSVFGGGKSQPQNNYAAPDYAGAAVAQGAANEATARINARNANPNIRGPLGSQTVSFEGDQPNITQTLTPQAQSTLEAQQRVQGALASLGERGAATASGVLNTPFDSSGAPLQTRLDLSNVARMPVNAGTTGQEAIMARLQPQIERMDAQTRTRLANQGLVPGGEAYQNAMMDVNQQKNDLMSQAALQGLNLDIGAQAQGFGQATNQMGVQNAAEQAELQRRLALRGQPLNEISGLMSGSQIMMPQFQGYQPSPAAPPPIMQGALAQGQSNMGLYGISSANQNAETAARNQLIGAGIQGAMAFSDRRLKSNIERIGTHPLGIGIYEYDIFGKHQIGVMADEVKQVMPEAIINHPSGYMMVDYGMLT